MINLTRDLVQDSEYYGQWFATATDVQKSMFWQEIWDRAAETHADNEFVQGLYDFWQINGYLTYKQFHYLVKALDAKLLAVKSLRSRLE